MPAQKDQVDSDTTTGAGTTTGSGLNTVGGQTTGGQITGGLAANAVTSGNAGEGTSGAGVMDAAPTKPQGGNPEDTARGTQATGGGRATPDFGPLARGVLSGGDTLDDSGDGTAGGAAGVSGMAPGEGAR